MTSLWVVACSRCRKAKVCKAGQKTTTCGHCGRTLALAHLKKHLVTDDASQAQHAAGLLNAQLAGRLDAFLEVPRTLPRPPARQAPREARVRKVALELAARGPFGEADFAAALAGAGLPAEDPGTVLERLVAAGVLYEPRRGRFAAPP